LRAAMSLHNDTVPSHSNHTHHPLTPLGYGPEAFICISLYNGEALIPHLNLNPLQLTLLIITTVFFLFMVGFLPFHVRRLREKSVPVRKLFFTFLWVRYQCQVSKWPVCAVADQLPVKLNFVVVRSCANWIEPRTFKSFSAP
jgi:hypothetical protein